VPSDHTWTRFTTSISAPGLKAIGKLNVPLYRLTRGRLGGRVNKAPVLLLTTTGRKSGQKRTAPVVYLAHGDGYVVIGSNAGYARTPAWSLNLQANPDAHVEAYGDRLDVHARIAEGEERADLWRRMSEQFAGFDEYPRRTKRDIKLFVLEPRK
jgi:F420H(2)-dependent quinone reductase